MSVAIKEEPVRFSGHDTFHCREQWLLKGLQLVQDENGVGVFRKNEAIPILGVGKNMVRSINHWIKAFGLLNAENELNELAKDLFIKDGFDRYLEKEGSLWLLQFSICQTKYASLFTYIFSEYFSDKATLEFSESQLYNFVERHLKATGHKPVTPKTFSADFKVLVRTYVSPVKNEKTVEDDFNAPLLSLNLISDTGRKNEKGEPVYRLNKSAQDIPVEIFAHCMLSEFPTQSLLSFDDIRKSVGSFLCLSNDALEKKIEEMCGAYKEFVYKEDAGLRQLQVRITNEDFKKTLLKEYYENK
ncbi:DUF4007 family protein [Salinimicrobium oceani]|uniref:DUF4007 family protein n=1 Tax=Salinimicrobium oceani TaxID=2722702 RepID=A0ABX1D567_9FLAO|nr:DUF4007 family protein [Salinimicrobium oceani]NJW54166.1 DUF4007 family protein [Salinimicrobium oceani]